MSEICLKPLMWEQRDTLFATCPITGKSFSICHEEGKFWASWDLTLAGVTSPDPLMAAAEHWRESAVLPYLVMSTSNQRDCWKTMADAPKDGRWIIGDFGAWGQKQMRWAQEGSHAAHWMAFGRWTPVDPIAWTEMPTHAPPNFNPNEETAMNIGN